MVHLITELSKYTMILLFALYTWQCYSALGKSVDAEEKAWKFQKQVFYMYLFHFNAYAVLFLSTKNQDLLKFYLAQVLFFAAVQVSYGIFYKRVSKLVVNNMCMLMCIGFVILTRLSYEHAVKQFVIAIISMVATMLIPYFISRWKFVRSLTWMYALAGITLLGVVAVLGAVSHGAKLSFSVAGITVQPSEFIKIIFVFFVASLFYESTEFVQVVKATAVAALHVVILVLSKDLGAALIFFIAYMVMLYVATRKLYYFAGGLLCGAAASVVAYFLFSHVRVRVVAWQDPLAVFEREGNQISNSLFAIGTGGWFGMGLGQGMPYKIPEVKQDFIFSAVAEELGGIFAICLILVCVSCFLMFLNIAMQIKDFFYKLVALGLGTIYGFQIFLSIGGDIKFIPSTGVTLPLVSYGGSSLLSTLIIFAIIQGLYLLRERGEEEPASQKQPAGPKELAGEGGRRPRKKAASPKDAEPEHSRRPERAIGTGAGTPQNPSARAPEGMPEKAGGNFRGTQGLAEGRSSSIPGRASWDVKGTQGQYPGISSELQEIERGLTRELQELELEEHAFRAAQPRDQKPLTAEYRASSLHDPLTGNARVENPSAEHRANPNGSTPEGNGKKKRLGRKGGISSHEKTIHGTKVHDFD